jgi:hypothetical protein
MVLVDSPRVDGRVSIDLPTIPPAALDHLGAFLSTLTAPRACG